MNEARSYAPTATARRTRRIHVIQGDYAVVRDDDVVLTTILGSCVACCMRDPVAKVGGMNHFLLPSGEDAADPSSQRYGVNSMELLINGLLQRGARRDRLEAKLFGGGRLLKKMTDIGRQNGEFATGFLRAEEIPYLGGSLGGDQARRVEFWPISGRARQILLTDRNQVFDSEVVAKPDRATPAAVADDSLELF